MTDFPKLRRVPLSHPRSRRSLIQPPPTRFYRLFRLLGWSVFFCGAALIAWHFFGGER